MSDQRPPDWRGDVLAIVGAICLIYLPAALVGALIGVILTDSAGIWNMLPAGIAVVIAHQWVTGRKSR